MLYVIAGVLLLMGFIIPNKGLKAILIGISIAIICWRWVFPIIIFFTKIQYGLAVFFAGAIQYGVALGINIYMENQTKAARRALNKELEKGKKGKHAYKLKSRPISLWNFEWDFNIRLTFYTILLIALGIFGVAVISGFLRSATIPIFWVIALFSFTVMFVRNSSNPANNYMSTAYIDYYVNNSLFMIIFVNIIGSQVFAIFGRSNAFAAFLLNCISSMVCWLFVYVTMLFKNTSKEEFIKMRNFMCLWRYCQIDDNKFKYLTEKVKHIDDLANHPDAEKLLHCFNSSLPTKDWGDGAKKWSKLLCEDAEFWKKVYF